MSISLFNLTQVKYIRESKPGKLTKLLTLIKNMNNETVKKTEKMTMQAVCVDW